jgi:hypothetical protein
MTLEDISVMAKEWMKAWGLLSSSDKEKGKKLYAEMDEHVDFVSASRLIDIIFDLGMKDPTSTFNAMSKKPIFSKRLNAKGEEIGDDKDILLSEKNNQINQTSTPGKYRVDKLAFIELLSRLTEDDIDTLQKQMDNPNLGYKLQKGLFMPILFSKARTDNGKYLNITNKETSFMVNVKILPPNINIDNAKLIAAIEASLGVKTNNQVVSDTLAKLSVAAQGKGLTESDLRKAIDDKGNIIKTVVNGNMIYVDGNGVIIVKIKTDMETKLMERVNADKPGSVQSVEFNENKFKNLNINPNSTDEFKQWFNITETLQPAATQEEENEVESDLRKAFGDVFKSDKKTTKNVNGVFMNYNEIGDKYIQLMKEGVDNAELRKLMDIVNDIILGDFEQYEDQLKSFNKIALSKCN